MFKTMTFIPTRLWNITVCRDTKSCISGPDYELKNDYNEENIAEVVRVLGAIRGVTMIKWTNRNGDGGVWLRDMENFHVIRRCTGFIVCNIHTTHDMDTDETREMLKKVFADMKDVKGTLTDINIQKLTDNYLYEVRFFYDPLA